MNLTERTIKGYFIKERIAEGGMAQVYKAVRIDRSQDEPDVAIKVIAQTKVQEREVRILLRLTGVPHIVPLFDFWKDEELELAFLVMPLMEGTLNDQLNGTPIPLKSVMKWMADIVSGLSWVHAKGYTHRDLKPANLLVAPSGDIVVGDFGIAKVMVGGEITMSDSKTPVYAAPEQWKNKAEPRTDIFALAVIIYELLTGQHPYYDAQNKQYIPSDRMDFPSILRLLPTVPPALDAVLKRAGAMKPEDRYSDLGAFMTALEAAVVSRNMDGATRILTEIGKPLTAENPYQGLRAFDEKHQTLFYGREALTQDLLLRLGQSGMGGRFLAVVGPSGSGKSSVVRASLIPALKRGALPNSPHWRYTLMKPGEHPLKELHAALRKSHPSNPGNFMSDLEANDGLSHALLWLLPDDDIRVEQVLVVDQAEELFGAAVQQEERGHFLDILVRALTETNSRLRCIITLRADFLDRPLLNPVLAELLSKFTAFVTPLTQVELREAIERPLEQVNGRFDPGLVEIMLADVENQANALPLLQYTLAELYDRDARQGSRLTRQTYDTLGGLRGALRQTAETLYNGLDAAEQHSTRQMFLRLVSVVEGVEDTRRRAPHSEVLAVTSQAVVNRFANSRLLTVDRETVELAHEALLNAWERLQIWRDEAREDLLISRRLTQLQKDWQDRKHNPDFLLFGARLKEYETWQAANTVQLTPQEVEFLKQSRAEQDKRDKRNLRTRMIARVAALGFVAVVSGFGISNVQQRTEIVQQQATLVVQEQELAERLMQVRAGELAFFANDELNSPNGNAETAALLAVCALDMTYSPQADAVLGRSLDRLYTSSAINFSTEIEPVSEAGYLWAERLTNGDLVLWNNNSGGTQLAAVYSASGELIRTIVSRFKFSSVRALAGGGFVTSFHTSNDVVVWREDESRIPIVAGQSDLMPGTQILALASSNFISWSKDGTLREWSSEGTLLRSFSGHISEILGAEVMPDGEHLLSWDKEGWLRQWTVDGEMVAEHHYQMDASNHRQATGLPNGNVVFWDGGAGSPARMWLTDGTTKELQSLLRPFTRPWILRDGRFLIAKDSDLDRGDLGKLTLWNTNGDLIDTLEGHTARIVGVQELSDGRFVSWDVDGVNLLRASSGAVVRVLEGDTQPLNALIELDNGQLIGAEGVLYAGGENDGRRLYLWTSDGDFLRSFSGHTSRISQIIEMPNRQVMSISMDNTVRIWDLGGTNSVIRLPAEQESFRARFSPDGLTGLTISDDMAELLYWETGAGKILWRSPIEDVAQLAINSDPLSSLGFVGLRNGDVQIWDLVNGRLTQILRGHSGIVHSIVSSPNGQLLATGGNDRLIVWNLNTGIELAAVQIGQQINDLAFSSDNATVLIGTHQWAGQVSRSSVLRWNWMEQSSSAVFVAESDGRINSVAYHQNGRYVAIGKGNDVLLLDATTGATINTFTGHTSQVSRVRFAPDGSSVLSASYDGTMRLHNLATGDLLRVYSGHLNAIYDVGFSADGRTIYSVSQDGTVRTWNTDYNDFVAHAWTRIFRDFTPEERQQFRLEDGECPYHGQ